MGFAAPAVCCSYVRRACRTLKQHRFTQRRTVKGGEDENALTRTIIGLANLYSM